MRMNDCVRAARHHALFVVQWTVASIRAIAKYKKGRERKGLPLQDTMCSEANCGVYVFLIPWTTRWRRR